MFVLRIECFIKQHLLALRGLPRWTGCKESTCQCRRFVFDPFGQEEGNGRWRKKWQPTPVFLPGESHGQRNLAGYSPWGHKDSDRTEQLTLSFLGSSDSKESAWNVGDPSLIPGLGRSPGERNGYPLQYSCLENPMDRGTWLATVHGVTKSWTWLSN